MQEKEAESFESELRGFGRSMRAEAEKPNAFWTNQRARVREKLRRPALSAGRRAVFVWTPAVTIVVMGFFWFTLPRTTPPPDIATGFDQRLLIEVEQALKQSSPDALIRAGLITSEMQSAVGGQQSAVVSR